VRRAGNARFINAIGVSGYSDRLIRTGRNYFRPELGLRPAAALPSVLLWHLFEKLCEIFLADLAVKELAVNLGKHFLLTSGLALAAEPLHF
jgi:hypothetical protein